MIRKVLLGVRDPRYDPKRSVAQNKTHGHFYHIDFVLCDRSRVDSGFVNHWHLPWVMVSQ